MEPLVDDRSLIKNYLLGGPELVGREDFEIRLLTDKDFLHEFSLIKDELVADYVRGALSDDETVRFEKHFLSTPRRVRQVEIVRGLAKRAAQSQISIASWSKYWPIAAALSLAMLAGVFVWIITQSKHPTITDQQRRLSALLEKLNDPRTISPSQAITSITLKQVYVRGSDERRIVVSQDKTIILLQLEILGETHESYRASLQTGEGRELGMVQNLKPDTESNARILKVKLPTDQLTAGSYQIKLEGLNSSGNYDAVGLYPFQVVKS
jgi:hypothetical protein